MVVNQPPSENKTFVLAVLGFFATIFFAEHLFAIAMTSQKTTGFFGVSIATLYAFGGVSNYLITQMHEYYRLLTAGFIHVDFMHLVFNSIGLYIAISSLEMLINRIWIICIFLIGTIGSSLFSIYFNDPYTLSAGASGGVMALLAAVVVFGIFSSHEKETKQLIITQSLQILIPSMLPFINGKSVDIAGHIGGFVTGSIISGIGVILLNTVSARIMTLLGVLIILPLLYFAQYGAYKLAKGYASIKNTYTRS